MWCGYLCSTENEETCLCPTTHFSNGSYCVDLCSAGQVPKGLCPNDDCIPDDQLGFKCKCEGKLTYDQTGVSCRKKLMCSEGNGTGKCAKYNARCVEDPDHMEGFRCICDNGKGIDTDGVCKNKCELSKKKEECQARKAICELDGLDAICKCPPMLTFDYTGQCAQLVKISYSGELPLASSRYAVKKQSSPSKQAEENSIDYEAIKKDIRASMHMVYGENYKFADILSCSIVDQDVKCVFEVHLLIDKKNLKPGSFAETDPCLKDIKEQNCGRETNCKKVEGKGLNFECACAPGFESYAILQPFYDPDTVVHRCQDIDECLNQKACPNRTRCLNSYGSYECVCLKGFRPLTATSDPKISGCVDVCDATVCKHGKCQVIGEVYGCLCDAGYTGLSCDLEEKTAGSSGMRTALIILSTLVVPLILFSIFILYKYRLLLAKNFQSNYFDDQNSSTINLRPISNNEYSSS
ncbi:uncharacterized protein TNIN_151671 [Trichonephila inaurata madagascariensis]|uniref:EGF-like domain-containing protein n=1 Tax=Trichonephila inaurata madagascariensis TaxID=2747483 RepID=A0A8X6XS88_9ARAC|nr:uncharacterized protein TNIN_151671 [Trichonephila inaurata madagascariensis]